jgi:hypothetical protein
VACKNLLTYHFLGDRSMKTFTAFVLPTWPGPWWCTTGKSRNPQA